MQAQKTAGKLQEASDWSVNKPHFDICRRLSSERLSNINKRFEIVIFIKPCDYLHMPVLL